MRPAPLLALATLVLTTYSLLAQGPTTVPALLFTLSKETTVVTSPLTSDGSPDYVAALNQRYGKDTVPQNNAFAALLQAIGTENHVLDARTHDKTLELLGIKATPPGVEPWERFDNFIPPGTTRVGGVFQMDTYEDVRRRMWKPEEAPLVVAYLDKEAKLLDRIVNISRMPQWWEPAVSVDSSVVGVLLPAVGPMHGLSQALCARAGLRASSGDFDGFLSDVLAAKRLARLQAGRAIALIDFLVAIACNTDANALLGNVAGSGGLTGAQCLQIRTALQGFGPFPASAEPIDVGERWLQLDIVVRVASGDLRALKAVASPESVTDGGNAITYLDREHVDWDHVLRRVNQKMDAVIKSSQAPTFKESAALYAEVEKQMQQWKDEVGTDMAARVIRPRDGETKEAYSERVAHLLMAIFFPSLGHAEELRRDTMMSDQMLDALLAAAQYKAKNGQWPASLQVLVPDMLKKVPADIYTDDAPVRFTLGLRGMRIHAIGSNGKDTTWPPAPGSGGTHVSVGATIDPPLRADPGPGGLP